MTVRRENTAPLRWTTDVAAGVKVPASRPNTCATLPLPPPLEMAPSGRGALLRLASVIYEHRQRNGSHPKG